MGVVKKEALEYLRDFPHDLVSLAFKDYSDGILFGFSVSYESGCIIISEGAVRYQGDVRIVKGITITTIEFGRVLYIKLIIGERRETADYIHSPAEILITGDEPSTYNNALELGRFSLNQGAILRCKYDSFRDLRTPENTLDITRVPYAGEGAVTLHPRVLKEYANALIASSVTADDIAFAMMCFNTGVIHKNCIQWHIAKKNGGSYTEYTLDELYEKLLGLLPQYGLKDKTKKMRGKGPSITD